MTVILTEKQLKEAVLEYLENADTAKAEKFAKMVMKDYFLHDADSENDFICDLVKKHIKKMMQYEDENAINNLIRILDTARK